MRMHLVAVAAALSLGTPIFAGELDREFKQSRGEVLETASKAATGPASEKLARPQLAGSELDEESPTQAWHYRRGWGYGGGWGYGRGWGGYSVGWGYGRGWGYGGGWGGYRVGWGGYGYGFSSWNRPFYGGLGFSSYYPSWGYVSYGYPGWGYSCW
jgi:hypothetical protein